MTIPCTHISDMAPYALADLSSPEGKELISLSQNECFRPPSPKVTEAVAKSLSSGMLYPDPDWTDLRTALAAMHNVEARQILCGNGSLDLIGALAHVYSSSHRAVLAPVHAYPYFRTSAQRAGARFDTAPENEMTVCVYSVLDNVQPDTGMVFIANPGNPTGTRIPKSDLVHLRENLRSDVLLVIDEAYGEFADHLDEPCFDMVDSGNTVVLRTFSKAYAMAGYRVGWGLFPPAIASEVRKVLNPNNVAMHAQIAAVAALGDPDFMRETCHLTIDLRDKATNDLKAAGYNILPSFTNFVLLDCVDANDAEKLDSMLRAEGIFLRRQTGAELPSFLRMTVGSAEMMAMAVSKLIERKEENSK